MINRRRSGAWVSAILLASAAAAPTYAVNLLLNPGFEAPPGPDENATASGWTFVGTAKRHIFQNHTPGGRYMLWARIFEVSGPPFDYSGVYQDVPSITPGANYDFTSYIFFETNYNSGSHSGEAIAARMNISWLDASNVVMGTGSSTLSITPESNPPTMTWDSNPSLGGEQPYSVSATAPAGAVKARVFVGWESGGTSGGAIGVFFDDVGLDGPGNPPTGSTWVNDAGGDWNLSANWANGIVPNAADAEAFFLTAISVPHTVVSDTAVTAGTLNFDNAATYVIAGAGSLSMQGTTGAGINVLSGSHKINLPLTFVSSSVLNVASGATLTIADPVIIKAGKSVTRTGAGSVLIQAPLTIESGGTLSLGSGPMSVFSAPTLQGTARINVGTQTMTVDYRGQASPAATIKAQLTTGYAIGAWNGAGIMSGNANSQKGVGWVDDPATQSIKVRLTYYGDANLDGQVNSVDFTSFVAGYGAITGGVWASGDFDFNGKVNTRDFNRLAANFGAAPLPSPDLGSLVPEPMSAGVVALAGLAMASRRRRSN